MITNHKFFTSDSRILNQIQDNTVSVMVTSPPYPMIEMWDNIFSQINPKVKTSLSSGDHSQSFELMHQELDKVWNEVFRVLKDGGIACINIGDATRSIEGRFQLFPSHSRVLESCRKIGFLALPAIIWRKETNAPNKFMGSGTIPPGAYVTLEHEYILILRKGGKREFKTPEEKNNRRESAFFWEERNEWFSDIWFNLKGTRQKFAGNNSRQRSGAFPFELAYRLVNMFSVKGDLVLDPFAGTGTVMLAGICSERNSISIDIEKELGEKALEKAMEFLPEGNNYIEKRLEKHVEFVQNREKDGKPFKHWNKNHDFPVVTRQETDLKINQLEEINRNTDNSLGVSYRPYRKIKKTRLF